MATLSKCVLAASSAFFAVTMMAALIDPRSTNQSIAYFEPQEERRGTMMSNHRMLIVHRSLVESNLRRRLSTSASASDNLVNAVGNLNIDKISEEVSKRISSNIVSKMNIENIFADVEGKVPPPCMQEASRKSVDSTSNNQPNASEKEEILDTENDTVKVFVMMGQSNMVGQGDIYGDFDGSLEYAIKNKNKYQHLIKERTDSNFTWVQRETVRYTFINANKKTFSVKRNGWLSVEGQRNKIGPEIAIGWILGDTYSHEPILLLKACTGHRSLGWDLLPPGSPRFEHDGEVYAGYGDPVQSWKKGSNPKLGNEVKNITWYGGIQYDLDTGNAKKVLSDLETFYPRATKYEVAGFFYWQGEKDRRSDVYSDRYEENLVRFIRSVRADFNATRAPFVVASVGFGGYNMTSNTRKVHQAQMNVDGLRRKYPDFEGNVKTVDARNIWRESMKIGQKGNHYGYQAEAYLEIGSAMGWAMVQLLKQL